MKKLLSIIRGWIFTKAEKDFKNSSIGKNLEELHQKMREMNEEIIERKVASERKCSETVLAKEFLMKLFEGLYIEEFKPGIVYVANICISEEELQKTIEWVSKNKLHPGLLNAKETDEKWEGKFAYNFNSGDRCIEGVPEDGFYVKLTIDKSQDNFQFRFVNIFTDREWKMRIMFAHISEMIKTMNDTIKKMNNTKEMFTKWMMLRS